MMTIPQTCNEKYDSKLIHLIVNTLFMLSNFKIKP